MIMECSKIIFAYLFFFLAHLSQRFIWWAYRKGRSPSSICRLSICHPYSLNISSESTRPIEAKFHNLHGMGERKFVQMLLVTWPRWPPCPYMVKTLKKSSPLQPKGWWPWNLVCSSGCSSTTNFVQTMTLAWQCFILWHGQIWSIMILYVKKVKHWIFQTLLSSVIWKEQQMIKMTRSFCWHQSFVPWGLYAPWPRAI